MAKFFYNLFLLLFVIDKESIKDTIIGTTIFLITGNTTIKEDEYLKLKKEVFESNNYHYFKLGMVIGKFFFKRALCRQEDNIEVEKVTSSMIYGCFQDVVECNLSSHISNICKNQKSINNIICHY